jgi:peptide deformylase
LTLRRIAQIGHPVLREKARNIPREELRTPLIQQLIDDLIETMREANGAGLAANQVHAPLRVCVIEVADNPRYPYKPNIPLTVLVNPHIVPVGEETFSNYEGCLSVPNLRGVVERQVEVRLRAWDREGNDIDRVIKGLSAGTFQHEVDHLDGKLFVDRVDDTSTLCNWAHFDRYHATAFAQRAAALVARFGG